MQPYIITTFYKFTFINERELMREHLLKAMKENSIKGTIILAAEGINGTICGMEETMMAFMSQLKSYTPLHDLTYQQTLNASNPFDKAKVKLRKEAVTLGVENVNPEKTGGKHIDPVAWNELISDPHVLLIDTRNDYEIKLGTFKGAINPQTENFRDFPEYVQKHLIDKKDKKIAMFCTGGIRCEKSTSYLKTLGFDEVYQLKGGILNYLSAIPQEASLWQGECFVFDNRVALNGHLESLTPGSIDIDWKNKNKKGFTETEASD